MKVTAFEQQHYIPRYLSVPAISSILVFYPKQILEESSHIAGQAFLYSNGAQYASLIAGRQYGPGSRKTDVSAIRRNVQFAKISAKGRVL
eukprot:SAG22_NODE_1398_length_4507_cov_9.035617_6_plen_90_part_00